MTCKMRSFRIKHPEEFYEFWAKYMGSRVSYLKKKFPLDKGFVCLFNNKGDYFLYQVDDVNEKVDFKLGVKVLEDKSEDKLKKKLKVVKKRRSVFDRYIEGEYNGFK